MSKVTNIASRWEELGQLNQTSHKPPKLSSTAKLIEAGELSELDTILKTLESFSFDETTDEPENKEDTLKERNEKTVGKDEVDKENVQVLVTPASTSVEESASQPTDAKANEDVNDEHEEAVTMRKDQVVESEERNIVKCSDFAARDSHQEEKDMIKEAREKLKKTSSDFESKMGGEKVKEEDETNEENKDKCNSVVILRKDQIMEEERKAVKSSEYIAKDSHKEEKDMIKEAREKLKKTSRDLDCEIGEADIAIFRNEVKTPAEMEANRKSGRLSLRNSLAPVKEDEAKEDPKDSKDTTKKSNKEEEAEMREPEYKAMIHKLQRATSFESFKEIAIKTFMSVTDELSKVQKEVRELKSSSAPVVPTALPVAAPPPPPPPPPPMAPPPKLMIVVNRAVSPSKKKEGAVKPAPAFDLMAEIKKKQMARNNRSSLRVRYNKMDNDD